MNIKIKALMAVLLLATPALAFAVDCNSECPSGQVMIGLLGGSNGNSVDCSCVEPGAQMDDHPADGNPPSGGQGQEE